MVEWSARLTSCEKRRTGKPDLRASAVDKQLDAGDVARVIRGEEGHRFGNLVRLAYPAKRSGLGDLQAVGRNLLVIHLEFRLVPRRDNDARRHDALTRISRPLRSVAQLRANERKAAFVAA